MTEVIDAEIVETTDLVNREAAAPGLFGTDQPAQIIAKATDVADVLKAVVVKQGYSKRIGQSDYILVEGWTTLGNLVGVFPKVEWTRPITGDDPGWEAAVVVVNSQGVEIGRAEAMCLRSERNWKNRDDFAIRSMAQTRAMGKALRMPLGWIATLAGYEATPAEEMPAEADVPFESSLPIQDPARGDDPHEAHGTSGTGGEGSLVDQLYELSDQLGADEKETHAKIKKNLLDHPDRPDLHERWLKRQIELAKARIAEKASA